MMKQQKWMPAGVLVAVAVIALVVAAGQGLRPVKEPEPTPVPIVTEVPTAVVTEAPTELPAVTVAAKTMASNVYIEFAHPTENADDFVHEQEISGDVISEKYYMMVAGEKKLLYSIDFGKGKEGNWLGLLELDTGEAPVTYTIYAVPDEELMAMSETERQHYSELMSGLGLVLDSISSDSRFRAEKPLEVGETKASSLTYWTVELPGNMTWTETEEDGEYQAIFYGAVQGEQVPLYTVRIGDIEAQSVLGKYRVNGQEKTLSVESFDLAQNEGWSDDDYSAAYRMMSTINDVIQAIMTSEAFAAE